MTKEKEVKEAKEVKQPISYKEDPSFGKRLNFTVIEDNEKKKEKAVEAIITVNNAAGATVNKAYDTEMHSEVVKNKMVEFNRRLRKNPSDVNLWLEFVNFQDEVEGLKTRKLIDRKISILKKAIELNSDLKIILEHLRLAEEIEESSTLMRLWEGYLKKTENSADFFILSMEYLKFRQKKFLSFSFEQVNEAFSDILKVIKRNEHSHVSYLTTIYKNYFEFLKRGGFNERFIALFQVLIEVNIEKYNYGEVDLEAYEDQYEIMEHIGGSVIESYTDSIIEPCFDSGVPCNIYQKWIKLEKYRELIFWHPKNTFDLEGQVIFDDLKDFIIIFSDRNDILLFIKNMLIELDTIFLDSRLGYHQWYVQVFKTLLPYYKNDWEFVFYLFKTLNPNEADSFTKSLLSESRDSLEIFFAYGRFQEFLGNHQMALKVYESLRKRTLKFEHIERNQIIPTPQKSFKKLEFTNPKEEVYDLVRLNPGDKDLYMRIIEAVGPLDPELALEIFNLIDEQQLRLLSFLEEV